MLHECLPVIPSLRSVVVHFNRNWNNNPLYAFILYKTYREVEANLLPDTLLKAHVDRVSVSKTFIEGATKRSERCRPAVMLALPRALPLNASE